MEFSAAIFSRKCTAEDVPGINKIFGERCNSHASATCISVRIRTATSEEKRGGLQHREAERMARNDAITSQSISIASSARWAMLYSFCADDLIFRASAACVEV